MITLYEVKEWLRLDLDSDYEDNIIEGLISVSSSVIEIGTGVTEEYIKECTDKTLKNLYRMAQLIIIANRYNERSTEDKAETSLLTQIEARYGVLKGI